MNWGIEKKAVSFALILSQLMLGAVAYADAPDSPNTTTPERSMLISAIALSGDNLPPAELNDRLNAALAQYDSIAPKDGRVERTEQALVSLGVFSARQAQAFMGQAQEQARRLSALKSPSTEQIQNTFQSVVASMAAQASGAQFSACILIALPASMMLIAWPAYFVNEYAPYGDRETGHLDLQVGAISTALLLVILAAGCAR